MAEYWEEIIGTLDQTGFLALALAKEEAGEAAKELLARCDRLASLVGSFGLSGWSEIVEELRAVLSAAAEGRIGPSKELAEAVARGFELLLEAAEGHRPDPARPEGEEVLGTLRSLLPQGPSLAPATEAEGLECLYEVTLEVPRTATRPNLLAVLEGLDEAGEVMGCELERDQSSPLLRLRFRLFSALAGEELEERLRAITEEAPGAQVSICPIFFERPAPASAPPVSGEEAKGEAPAARPPIPKDEEELVRLVLVQQRECLEQVASLGQPYLLPALAAVLQRLAAYLGQAGFARRAEELLRSEDLSSRVAELQGLLEDMESVGRVAAPSPAGEARPPSAPEAGPAPAGAPSARTLRVDEAKVDRLMALAGELVVACNSLPYVARRLEVEFSSPQAAREVREHHAALSRLVRELQDAVMDIRLLPASFVFQKFPRMIRDLARDLGKQVELRLEGEDTEIDKTVMQAISEPLVHLVRNAVDHGLEPPEERLKAGKPATGRVVLRAAREGSKVVLEVEDDGRGIDVELVRRQAVAAGLGSEEEAMAMSEGQVLEYLFLSGFSTRKTVSAVSGRGVGLDAVRAAVQRLGGRVSIRSSPNAGTTVSLELPVTVTTSRVLVVRQNGIRYGIPAEDVREMVKLPFEELKTLRGREVVVLRGEVLPVVFLGEFLWGESYAGLAQAEELFLVVTAGYALAVEDFVGLEDIVLKPLGAAANFDPCLAGAAVLGDGGVLLVLNPYEISAQAEQRRRGSDGV